MKRAVRTVIRLVAAGLVVIGGMSVGLEIVRHRSPGAETHWLPAVLGSLAVVAGVVLFAVSAALAEQLTDDFDE